MSTEIRTKAARPRNIAVAGRELALAWADGHESFIPFDALRAHCPCALCRAESRDARDEGPLRLVRGPERGQIRITQLAPVGAYAVQIEWSDGHDTGIFSFEALRRACPCPECSARPEAGWR